MIALIKCHFKAKIPGDSHKFNIASEIQPTAEITIIEFLTQIPVWLLKRIEWNCWELKWILKIHLKNKTPKKNP